MFTGLSASGAMSNVAAQATAISFEPQTGHGIGFGHRFVRPFENITINPRPVGANRVLPRARRNC